VVGRGETHSGEDVIVQAEFGPDVVPPPNAVARWVRGLFRGERKRLPRAGKRRDAHDDLVRSLAPYTAAALVPAPRGNLTVH
jgi:hypothetical protein